MRKILLWSASLIFSLYSFSQPANDNPCGAILLNVQTGSNCTPSNPFSWTNATATAGLSDPGCGSYSTGDIWFKFVAPASGNVNIVTSAGSITDGAMALYVASSCSGPFTFDACNDDSASGHLMPYLSRTGLLPGFTYYIRFWDYNDATSGSIGGICVTDPTPALATTGRVSIGGIQNPDALFDLNGNIKIRGGNPGNNKVLTSDANGLATWQSNPSSGTAFSVRHVGSQSINNSVYQNVTFTNLIFDDAGAWSNTDTAYTCPSSGTYQFNGRVSWSFVAFSGSRTFRAAIFVNGISNDFVYVSGVANSELYAQAHFVLSAIVKCSAGDKITLKVYQDTGVTQMIDDNSTAFSGFRIY